MKQLFEEIYQQSLQETIVKCRDCGKPMRKTGLSKYQYCTKCLSSEPSKSDHLDGIKTGSLCPNCNEQMFDDAFCDSCGWDETLDI